MRINFNLYKKYTKYKQSRPIRVVAEELKEDCFDCQKDNKCIINSYDNISEELKEIDNMLETIVQGIEKETGVYREEKDFGNGVKLLETRISKEESLTVPIAQVVD